MNRRGSGIVELECDVRSILLVDAHPVHATRCIAEPLDRPTDSGIKSRPK
jgi:hypothetical protein